MSNRLTIKKLFNLPFVPDMAISVVGVMDVADAHVRAMESTKSNGKRFLLSEKTIKLVELTKILKKESQEGTLVGGGGVTAVGNLASRV